MATAATCTEVVGRTISHPDGGILIEYIWEWTATDGGAVGNDVSTIGLDITGIVVGMKTMDNGTNPTGGYTATFSDEDAYAFATLTATVGTTTYYGAPTVLGFPLFKQNVYLTVAGAGNAGQGKTILYVRQGR